MHLPPPSVLRRERSQARILSGAPNSRTIWNFQMRRESAGGSNGVKISRRWFPSLACLDAFAFSGASEGLQDQMGGEERLDR